MTTTTDTAAGKRYAALNTLCEATRYAYKEPGTVTVVWTKFHEDRAEVAADIRALAALGRTDRWKAAVESWAHEVETAETEDTFRWAFDQFGVWAAYAAE